MYRFPLYLLAAALAFVLTAGHASAQEADLTAAQALGITGPVTVEQGAAIAAHHTGGANARLMEQEVERGDLLLEYAVELPTGLVEVEVRERDGAVLEVEPADEDDAEDDDGDTDGEDDDEGDGREG
jgi:hypothetical protein